jgi:hypothetical protein
MKMKRIVIHNHLPPRAKDTNAFEHAVSREQEEKNRDEAYRKSGITRVDAKDFERSDAVLLQQLNASQRHNGKPEYKPGELTRSQMEAAYRKTYGGATPEEKAKWPRDRRRSGA